MSSAEGRLRLRHAIALGLLHGPTELLPISSSAHTELLPRLANWPGAQPGGEQGKAFEVALHVGAALALTIHMRRELLEDAARIDARRVRVIALSLAPPALAGYALERPIERISASPRAIAAGLLAGAAAMAVAEGRALGRGARKDGERCARDADAHDGLALGLAQAAALIPGVSRNGATLASARARGFSRGAAQTLSWHAGLPILFGAGALQAARLHGGVLAPGERTRLAVGGASALLSTLAGARLLDRRLREGQSLLPYALYRCALAALVLARMRADTTRTPI
jgi:undecaprenyl-diphosphatase